MGEDSGKAGQQEEDSGEASSKSWVRGYLAGCCAHLVWGQEWRTRAICDVGGSWWWLWLVHLALVAVLAKQYSLRAKREEQEQDSQHEKKRSLARIRARKAAKDLGYDEEESPF